MKTAIKLRTLIDREPARSAWANGVRLYAHDLLDDILENRKLKNLNDLVEPITREELLNGADDWSQYSYGGCSLIYDEDIALRLCTPSELKRTRNGERRPNSREEWLDTQARALQQAANMLIRLTRRRAT